MSFISIEFIILFVVTFTLYYTVKQKKIQKGILLLSSFAFAGYFHISFLLVALAISLATFFFGKKLSEKKEKKNIGWLYFSFIALIAFAWIILRYPAIMEYTANSLLGLFNLSRSILQHSLLIPIGISFYTFQAISYLTEIYWDEIEPEDSLCDFTIYMLFFMKFLSGPIERPDNFLSQLKEQKRFDYDTVTYGLKLFFLGLLKKTIIADNLAPAINNIFSSIDNYDGLQLVIVALIYPIQLYTDFSGYTDMALGGAMMFGFKLTQNFNRPFISKSITELWQRWHISLSSWVHDYVYLPLTSSFRQWGKWGISLSLFIAFIVIGVWHGNNWNFVIYGFLQGVFVVYEMNTASLRNIITKTTVGAHIYNGFSVITTYLLFAFSLIFFRSETLSDAWYFVSHLSIQQVESIKDLRMGITDHTYITTGVTFALLLIFEYFNAKRDLIKSLSSLHVAVRWTLYFILVFVLLVLGHLNDDSFIYVAF